MADVRAQAIAKCSPRYQETMEALAGEVTRVFQEAREAIAWDLPGWEIPVPVEAQPDPVGTMPVDRLTVCLADRKAGLTLHFWNPASYTFLDDHAAWLKEAGFKPMRGCLQFNRKSAYPVAAIGRLLQAAKASWQGDG